VERLIDFITTHYIVIGSVLVAFLCLFGFMKIRNRSRLENRERRAQAYVAALNELIAGRHEKAIELFIEAVRFNTENIDAYIKLGMLYRMESKPSQALKIHKELTIRSGISKPVIVEIYRNIINDHIDLKQYDEALTYCEKILAIEPKHRWALDKMPLIYEKKKDWKSAFKALKSGAENPGELGRRFAVYKTAHGKELMDRKQFHDARILFKEAIKFDRAYPAPYLFLGDAYAQEERRDDAMKVWRDFAEAVPKKSDLVFQYLDHAYYETGNYGAMEVFLTRVIEKDPDNYNALVRLGEIYFKKGEKDKAFEMTERSIKINPKSPEALSNLIMYLNDSTDLKIIKEKAISLAKLVAQPAFFICSNCGYRSSDILIQCPECESLDTFEY